MLPNTAFIFPGQGAQQVGMGKDLAERNAAARQVFEQANDILGFDLAEICFNGPPEKLEATDLQQPAILVTSVALWQALTQGGRQPIEFAAAAGLSLGEYTALHVAGALSFEDAVRLVHQRGQFMQQAAKDRSGGMVSILGMERAAVEELCRVSAQDQILRPANFNCPGQIVISGDRLACERAAQRVEADGSGKAVVLKVAGAFHSALMASAAEQLAAVLASASISVPRVPVISNVDVQAHSDPQHIRDSLYRQVCHPVRWQDSIEHLIASGIEEFIEVGPGRTPTAMMRKINRHKKALNISTAEAVAQFAAVSTPGSVPS